MDVSEFMHQLRHIEHLIGVQGPRAANQPALSATRRLIYEVDRAWKIDEIQHFAQVCSTEQAPMDLAVGLRQLADKFDPF